MLPHKRSFLCGYIHKNPDMLTSDFNNNHPSLLFEEIPKKSMGDFNINLISTLILTYISFSLFSYYI